MRATMPAPRLLLVIVAACAAAGLAAASAGATAGGSIGTGTQACPLTAADLSAVLGRTLRRVNLSDPKADPSGQCAFAVVSGGRALTPQVFLTSADGDVRDLRDMYTYYVQSRTRLATKPRVVSRPDVGPGAFTLTATTGPVTTLYFVLAKGTVGTLAIDLTDAPAARQGQGTVEKIFGIVLDRLR